MVIGALLNEGTKILLEAGIENSRLDSEVLLAHILKKDRMFLLIHREEPLPAEAETKFRELIDRRKNHEPVAYLTGSREFMSLNFQVGEGVLIPRPDTETLVEFVLEQYEKTMAVRIIDLCTGSGAIAVSLAHYLPNSQVTAVDISEVCVDTAKRNASLNSVADRVSVQQKNVFEAFDNKKYDCVVSNPPYIPSSVLETLEKDVREYEPQAALDGGEDGLIFYRHLAILGSKLLKPEGVLAFEVGHDQSEAVSALLKETHAFQTVGIRQDLAGIGRVVFGIKKEA